MFIGEELVNTMLDVCDGDDDGDEGGRKRETVVLVSYPSGCSRWAWHNKEYFSHLFII